MGDTSLPAEEVQRLVVELGNAEFKGNSYHLLQRNCNHFSETLCKRLTGQHPPSWVRTCAAQL